MRYHTRYFFRVVVPDWIRIQWIQILSGLNHESMDPDSESRSGYSSWAREKRRKLRKSCFLADV
jgi:hypothetical protein